VVVLVCYCCITGCTYVQYRDTPQNFGVRKTPKPEVLRSVPVGIHFTEMMPFSFNSRRKLCRMLSCRVRPLTLQFFDKSTAPLLSISKIIGFSTFKPIDSITRMQKSISCAHCVPLTYSADVTSSVTTLHSTLHRHWCATQEC